MSNSNIFCSEIFYDSSQGYFDSAISAILGSKSEVLLESYIFEIDSIGLEFLKALETASKNGAKVFVSVDRIGSWNSINQLQTWAQINDIKLHIFNSRLLSINKRNHRKLILIDKKILFLGSINISRDHLNWRDYGLQIQVSESQYHYIRKRVFLARSRWLALREVLSLKRMAGGLRKTRFEDKDSRFLFNDSLASRLLLARVLIRSIKMAKQKVWISSPYFLPRSFLLRALVRAAKHGVDVKIIIPAKSDVWFVRLATRSLLRKLNRQNIEIYSYQEKIWHAKSLIVDSQVFVGSHNWNHRSFLHDLEIVYVSQNSKLVHDLELSYQKDLKKCKKLTREDLNNDSVLIKLMSHIFYLFRYWL